MPRASSGRLLGEEVEGHDGREQRDVPDDAGLVATVDDGEDGGDECVGDQGGNDDDGKREEARPVAEPGEGEEEDDHESGEEDDLPLDDGEGVIGYCCTGLKRAQPRTRKDKATAPAGGCSSRAFTA